MPAKSDKPARSAAAGDAVADVLDALLPVHTAVTFEALADAAATAAERLLHAAYAFLYCESDDGRLERRVPASDVRRRSQHRAIGAFGAHVIGAAIDPSEAPAIAGALDADSPVATSAGQLFQGLTSAERADAAQQELGTASAAIVPLVSAGERLGALILLLAREPQVEPMRLFAAHVARAAAGLRQALG